MPQAHEIFGQKGLGSNLKGTCRANLTHLAALEQKALPCAVAACVVCADFPVPAPVAGVTAMGRLAELAAAWPTVLPCWECTAAAGHAVQEASEQWNELPEHAVRAVAPWHEQAAAAGPAGPPEQQAGDASAAPVTALHASGIPVMVRTAAAWDLSSGWQLLDDSAAASQLQADSIAEVQDWLVELRT